jgi:hypothetical protein
MERLAVGKRATKEIDMESFNLKKLTGGEVTITNKFASPENLKDNGDINSEWDNIKGNIKISAKEGLGYCEPKHHKPWFDEKCSKLVD